MATDLQQLVEAADLNALLRAVDGLCASGRWDELIDLAEACEQAVERGKQLWPIAAHIDYRLALEAPGDYAASVLAGARSRFALGPLSEVAASTHRWEELAPHLPDPQIAAYVAQERVLRGEDLRGDARAHNEVLEMPLILEEWEPTYALATYKSTFVEVAEPWEPKSSLEDAEVRAGPIADDPELRDALLDLVTPWTAESNGAARAIVVEGDAPSAAAALTFSELRVGPLDGDEALQRLAWAASSGGAHGRRRGAAAGRFSAWYVASLLGGTAWPPAAGVLEAAVEELRWFRWDEGAPEEGWVLRIAADHPSDGWAAALAATDVQEEAPRAPRSTR
ncbi:MAG: hypothetical protein H0V97_06180 [Actinobacteria bacterium]|nr:hypothetical protein [Actinomycetota bacterium]